MYDHQNMLPQQDLLETPVTVAETSVDKLSTIPVAPEVPPVSLSPVVNALT